MSIIFNNKINDNNIVKTLKQLKKILILTSNEFEFK